MNVKAFVTRWIPTVRRVLTSWWLIGLIGWSLVAMNYPLHAVLPRYAG